jgi:hypothetical protein
MRTIQRVNVLRKRSSGSVKAVKAILTWSGALIVKTLEEQG